MSFKILALEIELTVGATIVKLRFFATNLCRYELIFYEHIAEKHTSTFYFIKEIIFIKYNFGKSRISILGLKIELIIRAKILKLHFLPLYMFKLIFSIKQRCEI